MVTNGLRSTSGRLLPKGRKKGQKAPSPGHRPGYKDEGKLALRSTYGRLLPTGRKKGQKLYLVHNAFALTGRCCAPHLPRAMPWAGSSLPLRGALTIFTIVPSYFLNIT